MFLLRRVGYRDWLDSNFVDEDVCKDQSNAYYFVSILQGLNTPKGLRLQLTLHTLKHSKTLDISNIEHRTQRSFSWDSIYRESTVPSLWTRP